MHALILHPTAAHRTAKGKVRAKTVRTAPVVRAELVSEAIVHGYTAKMIAEMPGVRLPELRLLVKTQGLSATTKHTRAELLRMLATGVQVRAAAQDRCNASRRKGG